MHSTNNESKLMNEVSTIVTEAQTFQLIARARAEINQLAG